MDTLFISIDGEGFIFCPKCKTPTDNIDCDDYVEENCVVWCKNNCGEFLICPTHMYNGDKNSINYLCDGEILEHDQCSKKLTGITLEKYIKKHHFPVRDALKEHDVSDAHFYKIGVLQITALPDKECYYSPESDSSNNGSIELLKLDKPVYFIKDVDNKKYETDHGGVYLYYEAYCHQCDTKYKSYIWGD